MPTVITVDNISKLYHIGARQPHGESLRDSLGNLVKGGLASLRRNGHKRSEDLWALKDVSFDVKQGEIVGLIGSNGAGKSTLLKILSRITAPTTGRIELHGRVGSLLEVGTGFHPELTGRENVFLNGAILGMPRAEITRKFDEIVAFSEVERFIDTPVKYYSSGMYVRLAFAVAAHLEPEILIIDEVLAVGDAAFQKKCLGKISDVAGHGRTVLFVSHGMQAVRQLCSRAVWLRSGTVVADGPAPDVSESYLVAIPRADSLSDIPQIIRQLPPDPAFRLKSVVLTQQCRPIEVVMNGRQLELTVGYDVLQRTTGMRVFFDVYDAEGNLLFRSFHDEDNEGIPTMEPGSYFSTATIPANLLAPINYELRVHATVFNVRMCIPEPGLVIPMHVQRTGVANRAYVGDPIRGKLTPDIAWKTITEP